ncbi:MAG: coA-transferase family protein [Novosphingobium sp.]|nr:coA-transferase family protein [Novosphingobium sp.]
MLNLNDKPPDMQGETMAQTDIPAKPRPLAGIRVLDFTMMMAGPFCARMLADMGAEVIKVESGRGDLIRGRPPVRGGGNSSYFGQLNAGKRSIVLDLKNPGAIATAKRLAGVSDIVIENFRPGVMKRLGLDYGALIGEKADLIYCSISGFGQTGPSAGKPAYAPIIHAASGFDLANLGYQDDMDRPARTGIFMADVLAGIYAFGAIQTALFHRERSGDGQFIDVALMESMLSMLVFEAQEAQFPNDRRRPLYLPLIASDGYVIVAPVSQNNFERLAETTGHPEWKQDPRFVTIAEREQHWDALMALIEEWTRERPSRECEELLSTAGVPCSRYLSVGEALADPQLVHRGSLATIHDDAGTFVIPNVPFQFSGLSTDARPFVPGLGADSDDVLGTALGMTVAEIADLRAAGAFG